MKLNLQSGRALLVAGFALVLGPTALWGANAPKAAEKHAIVKSVDSAKHQVVLTDTNTKTTSTFLWNDKTKFTQQGKAVTATALKQGATVNVTYAPGTGTPVLEHVKFAAPKGTAKPAAPAAPAPAPPKN